LEENPSKWISVVKDNIFIFCLWQALFWHWLQNGIIPVDMAKPIACCSIM
jgi:hypothetical protein